MTDSKKKRIYEVAREWNVSSDALIKVLRELEYEVKNHMSTATTEMLDAIAARFNQAQAQVKVEESKRKEVHAAIELHKAEGEKAAKEARAREAAAKAPPPPPPAPLPQTQRPETRSRPPEARTFRPSSAPSRPTRPPESTSPPRHAPPYGGGSGAPGQRRAKGSKGRKKGNVDERAVRESFQKTMAEMEGPKRARRRRRVQAGGVAVDERENVIQAVEMMPLQDLAHELGVAPNELISKLFKSGVLATINQRLDKDTIEILAAEFEYEVEWISEFEETELDVEESEAPQIKRAPVVTIMGHVDHGKTSILDKIRRTNVVAGESGGITQHIGAYEVTTSSGHRITFLDTPGHEAFTAMRARGAQVTDLVVLVVAANDGVMPQTLEALNHARAASVPFLVAINKTDLPDANIDRVKQQLAQNNVLLEDWGGTVTAVEVSAKTGTGLDQLLDLIHLQAELLELKAAQEGRVRGVVLESRKTAQHGVVVSLLVQQGTLRVGDVFVAGRHSGRVRALLNERERRIESVGPADPVQVLGCDGVPQAGDPFTVVENDRQARDIASKRQQYERARESKSSGRVTLEQFHQQMRERGLAELKVVLKGDVDGSVEALSESLEKLTTGEVAVRVIHRGVGGINETDVTLAAASNAVVIGFHVRPSHNARELAKREGVDIRLYEVIYDVVNEVKEAMVGLLTPEKRETIDGAAEVRQVFRVPKVGTIAGCYVTSGKITRNAKVRVIRDHVVVYDATVSSLKRFKDDVREVAQNFECGMGVAGYDDLKVGDVLEVYRVEEVARTL
ncbi:MAG TPA: translation initiation factor IF-2 [Candidatus Krumholzibacteria bacterium]|nr:translation initiation factor IF-2 [Candidatus Krumholzibacteria bacterium]